MVIDIRAKMQTSTKVVKLAAQDGSEYDAAHEPKASAACSTS